MHTEDFFFLTVAYLMNQQREGIPVWNYVCSFICFYLDSATSITALDYSLHF